MWPLRRRKVAGRRPEPPPPPRQPRPPLPWPRIAGICGLVVVGGVMAWLTTDRAFSVDPGSVVVSGLRFTDPGSVRRSMRLVGDIHPATVVISTRSMEAAIEQLPAVASARVRATLPDSLTVSVTERQPILAWTAEDGSWLMDVEGTMFVPASLATEEELGDGSTGSGLPGVDDLRTGMPLTLGGRLDPVDLEAVRTLAAVTPESIGSSAPALFLSLDDHDGWVLTAPGHWRAVFGHYTQTLAPPGRIPVQVQCLRSLLKDRETTVDEVTLAVQADRCGTFRAGTPEPRPRPTRRPRGTARP